jgi:hypothetical protein
MAIQATFIQETRDQGDCPCQQKLLGVRRLRRQN